MYGVVWYSDDGGDSWTPSPTVFPEMQECQLVELDDGQVVCELNACKMALWHCCTANLLC